MSGDVSPLKIVGMKTLCRTENSSNEKDDRRAARCAPGLTWFLLAGGRRARAIDLCQSGGVRKL